MDLFRRIVFAAVLAGLIGGGVITVVHHFGTASIIARAEVYEMAADAARQQAMPIHVAAATPDMVHGSESAEWAPTDGWERALYTALADALTAIAFSLLLVAAYEIWSGEINWRTGMFWGLVGFVTFTLGPCLGLPPEVPGAAVGPLLARQIWWVATVAATGGALALLFFRREPICVLAALLLLMAPHLYGAPQPAEYKSAAPEDLAREFVVASILSSLLLWMMLGVLTGAIYRIMNRRTSGHAVAKPLSR
jgi:cobalt transporter subunit CbtA